MGIFGEGRHDAAYHRMDTVTALYASYHRQHCSKNPQTYAFMDLSEDLLGISTQKQNRQAIGVL